MKLTNGQIQAAIKSMAILCNDPNRLPTLAASRAGRTLVALQAAFAAPDKVRNQIISDHGTPVKDDDGNILEGQRQVLPGAEGWDEFVALMGEEQDVGVATIRPADVEAGWHREDGKKEAGLDISPAHLAILEELGFIAEPEAPKAEEAA